MPALGGGADTIALTDDLASPPPDKGRANWLLGRIKAIADAGPLFEPDKLAKILEVKIEIAKQNTAASAFECDREHRHSYGAVYIVSGANWYVATDEGIPPIHPYWKSPVIKYNLISVDSCVDNEPSQYRDASVHFGFASTYACVSMNDVEAAVRDGKYLYWSHGVVVYEYTGKYDDMIGTVAKFFFEPSASKCASSIHVEQSEKLSKRFLRVRSRFIRCAQRTGQEFCRNHGSFEWNDTKALDLERDFEREKCGTIASNYLAEPFSGETPEPLPIFPIFGGLKSKPCN